jgi:hypothetical protein
LINFTKLDPIKALVWSAIINGVASGPCDVLYDAAGQQPEGHREAASSGILKSGWLGGGRYHGTRCHRNVSYLGVKTNAVNVQARRRDPENYLRLGSVGFGYGRSSRFKTGSFTCR